MLLSVKLYTLLTMRLRQILQVKEKLSKEKGWDVQNQKLIFSGMDGTLETNTMKLRRGMN